MASGLSALKIDFDPVALKQKYLLERDRRLRKDGDAQFIEVRPDGPYGHFLTDPYCQYKPRGAIVTAVDCVVLGGGFGGLITSARLAEAGIRNFKIIERGGDFGGTWYWNRYPGAYCDIESYVYLPLLEETNYVPVEKYTRAPEILAHCDRIARKYDLHPHAIFSTMCTGLRWDERSHRWTITTDRGDVINARFVVQCTGGLDKAKLPGQNFREPLHLYGLSAPVPDSSDGHALSVKHTSRWDYSYTGGDSLGGLVNLRDKTVGIIGTGATSVQCVPYLGEWAKKLYVFQRTPSSVAERGQRATDPKWAASLKPGWQKERIMNFELCVTGGRVEENLVNDGWTAIFNTMRGMAAENKRLGSPVKHADILQMADFKIMEGVRRRVDAIVKDPKTAEALKPWYNQFCKRPCFHDEYLDTFNRPNVELVDTSGKGVERLTESGVVVDGKLYECDCLIFATGFEYGTHHTARSFCKVFGRNGLDLDQKWADGAETVFGLHTRGFPNYFFVRGYAQVAAFFNLPHSIEVQATGIVKLIDYCMRNGVVEAEASEQMEKQWVEKCVKTAAMRKSFFEDCTPGYYNLEGQVGRRLAKNQAFGAGSVAYLKEIENWLRSGKFEGFEFIKSSEADISAVKASL
ncbi:hypothetical protein HDU93_009175 [Gonapodya sp. JEL0774]|nr:hypothetical protein HDU93_009175 [Gonapodya sp. JEL0774]